MSKKNQDHLPGVKPKQIPALEAAAEKYRGIVAERLEIQGEEAEAKGALMALCRKLEQSGELTIDLAAAQSAVVPVYRYQSEGPDGQMVAREIKHGFSEGVSVVRAKGE